MECASVIRNFSGVEQGTVQKTFVTIWSVTIVRLYYIYSIYTVS